MIKQLVWFGAAVMTTLLALAVLWEFRVVVMYVLVSLVLAAAMRPLVKSWSSRGWALRLALVVLCVVVLASLGFLLFLGSVFAAREVQQVAQAVSVQDEWRLPVWLKGRSIEQVLITGLPSPGDIFKAFTGDQGQLVLPTILGFTQDIAGVVSGVLIVVVLSFYWSINQAHFERLWLSLLPSSLRREARGIWRIIESHIGAYVRSQVIQSLLAGLLFGLGYWLLGSPYPALLAFAGALACLIPVVGVALAVILPLMVGLLTSVQLSLSTTLYTIIVLIALGIWVKPRLFNRRWDNPILTIILLVALADAFGLIGLMIAPPLSIACQILWSHLVSNRAVAGAAAQVSDLKQRHAVVLAAITAMDEPPLPLVLSSMGRLTRLIEQAEPILQAALPVESTGSLRPAQPPTTEAAPSVAAPL
jgi:predicted PurR-regulated permease PerM